MDGQCLWHTLIRGPDLAERVFMNEKSLNH